MKALLSVSFGTSIEATRAKTIDAIDAQLAAQVGDRAFYSAWTSSIIVKKVRRERGEHHDTLDEAFARMAADGVDDVVVSTMCLMEGHEMEKIRNAARAWESAQAGRTVHLASPLLATDADRLAIARALCDGFSAVPDQDALLLMGHGSQSAPTEIDGEPHDANAAYRQVQEAMHELGRPQFFMATVEGTPTFEDALALIEQCGARCVHLAPFMIVAGDHATNDLAGDDDDSWASQLKARGYATDAVLKGLGEYAAVQQLVVDHALAAGA